MKERKNHLLGQVTTKNPITKGLSIFFLILTEKKSGLKNKIVKADKPLVCGWGKKKIFLTNQKPTWLDPAGDGSVRHAVPSDWFVTPFADRQSPNVCNWPAHTLLHSPSFIPPLPSHNRFYSLSFTLLLPIELVVAQIRFATHTTANLAPDLHFCLMDDLAWNTLFEKPVVTNISLVNNLMLSA